MVDIDSALVSVYIPTKNRVEMLKEAIDSVLMQDYKHIEILVVNDGSTDSTKVYLEGLKSKLDNLVVINNETSVGAPRARNQALERANGRFVTGLDDDDLFGTNRVRLFIDRWNMLSRSGVSPSCLYSNSKIVSKGKVIRLTNRAEFLEYTDLFCENKIGNQVFSTKEFFYEAGFFDPEMPAWQDLEFFMRLLKLKGRAYLVNEANYFVDYSPRDDRITASSEEKLRFAWKRMSDLHAANSQQRKMLMLQLFWNYSIIPTWEDIAEYNRLGISGWGRIEMAFLKGCIKKWLR